MKTKSINSFGKQGWWIIIYVLLLFWISASPIDLLNVSVDAFAGMKQWDGNMLLVFSSIGTWVGIIVVAIFGRWVTAKGAKLPTLIGLVLLGLFFIFNGMADSIPMYGVAVVLLSAMSGSLNLVSTNTFMSNWFPKKKGIALGWSSMGMCLSGAVCIPLFAALLESTHTLTIPFAVFGAISIVIAAITGFGVKEWPEQAGAFPDNEEISPEQMKRNRELAASYKSEWTPKKLFRCGQMWLVSVTFGLLFIALMATMTQFVPRFMAAGFTNGEAIMWLTITSVLGIVGSYLWGYLDQKTNTKFTVIIYAIYMMAMQFLSAIFFHDKTISTILIVLIGILIGGIGNLFPSMVIQIFGRYDFTAANSVCVPVLTAIRACTFILIAAVLGATMGNYQILCVVLGALSLAAVLLSLKLSNKTIGKAD